MVLLSIIINQNLIKELYNAFVFYLIIITLIITFCCEKQNSNFNQFIRNDINVLKNKSISSV